jgi:ketosteroid isomerase-like protein
VRSTTQPETPLRRQRQFVAELFATIDNGEWGRLRRFFTVDCTYERPGYPSICGIEALQHFYREVRVIACGRHTIEGVACGAATIACWGEFAGTSREGEPLRERFADVYEMAGDRIACRRSFFFRPAI